MTKKNNPRKPKIKRRAARKAATKRRAAPDVSGIFRRPTDPGASEYTGPITFFKVYLRQLRKYLPTIPMIYSHPFILIIRFTHTSTSLTNLF